MHEIGIHMIYESEILIKWATQTICIYTLIKKKKLIILKCKKQIYLITLTLTYFQ